MCFILALFGCESQAPTEVSEDEFAKHIRTTDARTPADEKAGFTLPPGFEIQLFASEPDIGKPMNMAFDTNKEKPSFEEEVRLLQKIYENQIERTEALINKDLSSWKRTKH